MLTFIKFLDFDLDKDWKISNKGHVDSYRNVHLAMACDPGDIKKETT